MQRPAYGAGWLAKVPEITVYFWITKILTTAMGEATSDWLVHDINRYLAVVAGAVAFFVATALQMRARRYIPWLYWLVVVMVAVFGTMVADVAHIVLGVPYAVSSPAFAVILAAVFITWSAVERTLSIHSIRTPRRELFYWAAVLATFALGTATGDMSARTLHLGFLASGLLFAVLFAVPLVGRRLLAWNAVFSFWFAYVLTRPLGASFADWFGMPRSIGGLGIDRLYVAGTLTLAIAALVTYMTVSRNGVQDQGADDVSAEAAAGRHEA